MFFIEEKFVVFKFNYVVIGFYYYDNRVVDFVKEVKLLFCGEFEIIDLNNFYLKDGFFKVELMGWGLVWFDMGILDFLFDVVNFVGVIEKC